MVTRRLAAIVIVDVVGFSAMMAADEDGTLATLKAHRTATDPIILNHGGRIVKSTGDGVLVEMPSAVGAVRAAIESQKTISQRNAELPPERRMQYRIGISLGDVIVDDEDVHGHGVNIAARLEALADPGGILVSDAVHHHAAMQIDDVRFHDRGEQRLKNIPEPVRVWEVDANAAEPAARPVRPFSPDTTVAVLPFADSSPDGAHEYFADGITEDLITALSRDPDLQVVARNSVFAFKGRPTDARTVGRRLDARYIVEGSVRKAANRVRVNGQLIESESGRHLWADRYDRELNDVFSLQDEIVDEIRTRVGPTVRSREEHRVSTMRPDELGAWDLLQQARWHANRNTLEELEAAIELAERSIAAAPSAAAHAYLHDWWLVVAMQGWHIDGRNAFGEMTEHAQAAYRLAPDTAHPNSAMSVVRSYAGRCDEAVSFARRAVQHNPHIPSSWLVLGHALYFDGQHGEAVEAATESWRLGGHEPWRWHTATVLAWAHYLQSNYDASLRWSEEALALNDYLQAHVVAAAALGKQGQTLEADRHLERLRQERPGITARQYRKGLKWRNPADIDRLLDGLVAAGLPR